MRAGNQVVGYVIIVRKSDVGKALGILKSARCAGTVIGVVKKGRQGVILEN
jgi:phosphoribosylaminoimidazole (AIR) synthetase